MAQVNVSINGRRYPIACEDGQEAHLARLGAYVDKRVGELVAAVGQQINDSHLLVMVSLLVADELSDAYAELDTVKGSNGAAAAADAEDIISARMETLAQRIEHIAESLEAP